MESRIKSSVQSELFLLLAPSRFLETRALTSPSFFFKPHPAHDGSSDIV